MGSFKNNFGFCNFNSIYDKFIEYCESPKVCFVKTELRRKPFKNSVQIMVTADVGIDESHAKAQRRKGEQPCVKMRSPRHALCDRRAHVDRNGSPSPQENSSNWTAPLSDCVALNCPIGAQCR